jgi:hypothetical protein
VTAFEDRYEWKFGSWCEECIEDALVRVGHLVTRTALLPPEAGHGPRWHGQGNQLVPPDLDVVLMPWAFPVHLQVKGKANHGDLGRHTHEVEHGFGWEDFKNYRAAEKRLEVPVFVVIVEAPGWPEPDGPPVVLAQRVSELRVRPGCPTVNRGQLMAYFTRSQFTPHWVTRLERCAEQTTGRRRPPTPPPSLWGP